MSVIPDSIARENITLDPLDLHMEVFDTSCGDVWLHQSAITEEQYKRFKPAPPFVKSGMARSAMDVAYFLRSPGAAADGPLETRVIGGLDFVRVARPLGFRGFGSGAAPTRLTIEKHHVIGFNAGSRVHFARLPDGRYYVQQTGAADGSVIPEPTDWEMVHVDLAQPWGCDLGCPVTVYFFRNLRSFQGPLEAEQLPDSLRG